MNATSGSSFSATLGVSSGATTGQVAGTVTQTVSGVHLGGVVLASTFPVASPLSAQSISSGSDGEVAMKAASVVNSAIQSLSATSATDSYNVFTITDFTKSGSTAITSGTSSSGTNLLSIGKSNGFAVDVDVSTFKGLVATNTGVNIAGVGGGNYLYAAGGGTYSFGAGNAELNLQGPNAVIHGGKGLDTVVFDGVAKSAANIVQNRDLTQIYAIWSDKGSGATTMDHVARAKFTDGNVALDTGAGQNAGEVFRLYEAVFHRAADQAGMGYWLNQVDKGASLLSVANEFISSNEFVSLFGKNPTNSEYVMALYKNVLGRAPDAEGLAFWEGALKDQMSKAQLLTQFTESSEGVKLLAGQMTHGVEYQPWLA